MDKIKALVLMSGGLDSTLAVKILQAQGIYVGGVCFFSNFYGCDKAKIEADKVGIKLNIVDITKEMLELVKNPPSGYGKHMNPCVDCRVMMIRKAAESINKMDVAGETGSFADAQDDKWIIATGEVLEQRPMSQNRGALKKIEELAGLEILRPLSAKLLPETDYEKKGLVKRHRLYDIKGRGRYRQEELAKKFGLKEYFGSAGGCLLTDQIFSERLIKMFDYWPDCDVQDVELLKNGRVFWLKSQIITNKNANNYEWVLVVVGRNKEECGKLEKLVKKGDVVMELKDIKGPLTLLRNSKFQIPNNIQYPISNIQIPNNIKMSELKMSEEKNEEKVLETAALLTGWYATKARNKTVAVNIKVKE